MLERGSVEHNSQNIYYRSTVGAAETESEVVLGIRIRTEEEIKQVLLRTWQDGAGEKLLPLTTKDTGNDKFYSVSVTMPSKGCLLWYYFIIAHASGTSFYGNKEDQLGGLGEIYDHVPPSYQITVYLKGAKTPDWFKHSVMYQIFPDRFYRSGDRIIPKKRAVIHADWNDSPMYYKDPTTKAIVAYDFFGGNLKGVEEKLEYLKDLGINTIYFNPVFESESNHHYDTGDYHKIDPMLGTNEDFRELVDKAREMGIRIILDGVFSHSGSNSIYFNALGEYNSVGACQSKNSPYFDWYTFHQFPTDYDAWWGHKTLPNIREITPSYMDFIIRNDDSVLHHWLNEGIGGWRLDVVDELPPEFSQAFYAELKKLNPEAVLIGEVWEDASNKVSYGVQREYLCGGELDSAMNYPFREQVISFLLGHIDGNLAMRRLESLRENYPKENFYAMMNLLGSHDRMRILTILGEAPYYDEMPDLDQARYRLDESKLKLGIARLKMATMWQMTYPGVPSVYYGDEIGMQGFKDPYCRGAYDWEHADEELRGFFKTLISIRNEHTALRTGELLPLHAGGDIVAYARTIRTGRDVFGVEAENETFVVAFNRAGEERQISFDVSDFADGKFIDVLNPSDSIPVMRGRVYLNLKPLTGILLKNVADQQHHDRKAGILLHPTSLPTKYGIGDFGQAAYDFVDYLESAGQTVWQMLPLNPVGYGYSPYQSPSAFAGNPMLISVDDLVTRGLLEEKDLKINRPVKSQFVDFAKAEIFKTKCLKKASDKFREMISSNEELRKDFDDFCTSEAYWLEDYALFTAIKEKNKLRAWTEWDEKIRTRDEATLKDLRDKLRDGVFLEKFKQYIFHRQWEKLHNYARSKKIEIMGDMPIFVSADSADVWANQKMFDLNKDGTPKTVAGVPPDYFSATGQLWGNPLYDWKAMQKDNYGWWKLRFKRLSELVDIVRIDHFRGFESYWEIDGEAETAIDGKWQPGPGKNFFYAIEQAFGKMSIVAEDLGIITDEVEKLRADCGFPGMKVLHFTLHFNEEGRMGFVAPENSIVYTGTHDNNTTVGWYLEDLDEPTQVAIAALLGADWRRPDEVCSKLIEFGYASNARMTIVPMQDVLKLDSKSRMNTPGTVGINWRWSMSPDYKQDADAAKLRALCQKYKR